MATKAQEREALLKIRKIVEDLGEDSYIGMAFQGVWEIAEENIENDFGNSCQYYVDALHDEEQKRNQMKDQHTAVILEKNAQIIELEHEIDRQERELSNSEGKCEELERELDKVNDQKHDAEIEVEELKGSLKTANDEIIKLKAKLFDLLYKED